ncbi:PIN domain-like protein [Mrakia frigida]|uniref:exonuclease 1 n=1 Tax=Mrakia frigida TaxID=29902 RepID=UPI003FCBF214
MGIQGLIPVSVILLKPAHTWKDISDYSGKTLAVDAYVWLHKGAFSCAEELVRGKQSPKLVNYCMHRVRLLKYHGVKPYIVFDGGDLPAKLGTEDDRAQRRSENLLKANALHDQGRIKEARELYTKCIDVTPELALQFIKALKAENVDFVVAPYEADAQLAYLERNGIVDGIITEDSDLLVFGCKNVLFKMDGDGKCCEIRRETIGFGDGLGGGMGGEIRFDGWGDSEFRHMAILSGCDYIPSIHGVGIKTAHKLLRKLKTVEKVLQHLRLEGKEIPADYRDQFRLAELTFLHQRVYDSETQRLVPLSPLPEGLGEEEGMHIGP